jgi:hypothetical protein
MPDGRTRAWPSHELPCRWTLKRKDCPLSLSSHLEDRSSPVRRWLEERFPETRRVTTRANRQLRGGESTCPIPRVAEADASLVGTALDYLLRACLRMTSIERTVATSAVQFLSQDPAVGTRAIEVEREAVTGIKRLRPGGRDLTDSEWRELCIYCLVLARFEQFFRIGPIPAVEERLIVPLRRCLGLEDFVPMALTSATIEDLERLGRAAWEEHRGWMDARPLVLNPKFQQSVALGGADADLIVGRRLIDLKATMTPGIVGRFELWQLLGYALADTDDEYGIREVGIAALRWRSSISWPLEELFGDLAPVVPGAVVEGKIRSMESAAHDLVQLRAEFAQVVVQGRTKRGRALGNLPPRPGSDRA